MATLLPSISSDEEVETNTNDSSDSDDELDTDFKYGGILGEDGTSVKVNEGWSYQTALQSLEGGRNQNKSNPRMEVASLIAAKRRSLKQQKYEKEPEESDSDENESEDEEGSRSSNENDSSDEESSDGSDDDEVDDVDRDMEKDVLKDRTVSEEKEQSESNSESEVDEEEVAKEKAFFETQSSTQDQQRVELFVELTLSRPLLRGIAAMGFVKPTPIQSSVIPVALAGRDICASAVTGSGKTAAFLLPIMERLLHRMSGRTKALILAPTRELAAQCLGMMTTFSQYTKLRASLIVGGTKNLHIQAAELRARPDIVIATPGRLLDHVMNTPGVTLEDIEFLVLDEADRLLDLGFTDEVHELIKACPVERQTLLFSATMNTKVDELVKLSLKRPVRIRITDKDKDAVTKGEIEVAPHLEQEFVRIRSGNEGINREAMLLALLTRTFNQQSIVFFDTKVTAHRMMIICGLCGIKCAELHGNLTQTQRLTALEEFRSGEVDILLATDLAARGLDIDRVEAVINFEMPSQIETYVHRIGRTARAGRGGKSCTLIGEGRRYLMKELIKDAAAKGKSGAKGKTKGRFESGVIRSRSIPPAVVAHFVEKIKSLETHLEEVMQAEAVARLDRIAEMEAVKAQNVIEHSDEISSRPQREWFASCKQKQLSKQAAAEKQKMIAEKAGTGKHRMTRKKRRAREAREALNDAMNEDDESGHQVDQEALMKRSVRAAKRKQEIEEKEAAMRTIDDEMKKRREIKEGKKKKRKVASDALGDSSLFSEERISHAPKKKAVEEPAEQSSYHFRGYDPDFKKGKKKSVNSFKSKKKYKRR